MLKPVENWIIQNIKKHDNVASISIEVDNVMLIQRKEGVQIRVAVISSQITGSSLVFDTVDNSSFDFLLNIPKNSYTIGSIFEYLDSKKISYGGLGDLFRLLSNERNWPYQPQEVAFIMRGLRQHDKVANVRRLDDRRYLIIRKNFPDVVILALNDYELNTESIKNGKEVYKDFDAILTSNPNARMTEEAASITSSMKIPVFQIRDLLIQLNRAWKK